MSVLPQTHISVQDWKGGCESSVLHSADISHFCLKKSSSGSRVTLNVNCRHVCISRTHISLQERKGGSESSVLRSADITPFSLWKSSSGSHVTVTVNSIDVCIAPDTYLCSRKEGTKWVKCTPLCRHNPVLFEKVKFRIRYKRNC
jgi:hypothetical protein